MGTAIWTFINHTVAQAKRMSIGKLILLATVIAAAVFWIRRRSEPQKQAPQKQSIESMVVCARCHVHIPVSQATEHNKKFYCSQHPGITDEN